MLRDEVYGKVLNHATLIVLMLLCAVAQAREIKITAVSWLVADDNGRILGAHNTEKQRSIASITKLATVMAVVESGAHLDELLDVKHSGVRVTRRQLINYALIRSDNVAAKMLCDTYPTGYDNCVLAMNTVARDLGMYHTLFTEPTGLWNTNTSTAIDLLRLVAAASRYPVIVEASNSATVEIAGQRRSTLANNTNPMTREHLKFLVSKTGFIRDSGGCIVMMLHTARGVRTVILLGSRDTKTRIPEARYLAELY